MGLFSRVVGTVAAFFQIGGATGPGWNNNAGAIEARNAANSAYAIARNANPVGQNDAVNLAYNPWAGPNTPPANGSWAVTDWYVSPATGNDSNSGTAIGSPLATKAELARRYGTWRPVLSGVTVTIHYLSADTTATDPSLFAPYLIHGGYFIQTSPLPAAGFTGTLLAVTAKNIASSIILKSTFTTTTGAIAAQMMLVNSTRGNSVAFVQRNTSGAIWQLSQPLQPYVLDTFPSAVSVDTWANGDAITGYTLTNVNIPQHDGLITEFDAAFGNSNLIYRLNIWDAGIAIDPFLINGQCAPYIVECSCNRVMTVVGASSEFEPTLQNVACNQLVFFQANSGNSIVIAGGFITGGWLQGVGLKNSVILAGSPSVVSSTNIGECAVDTASAVTVFGDNQMTNPSGRFYGPGTLNVFGQLFYAGATATVMFPVATILINNSTNAYSYSTSVGVTTLHQVAITAANITAAAGAAGFGGTAFMGGACITNGSAP